MSVSVNLQVGCCPAAGLPGSAPEQGRLVSLWVRPASRPAWCRICQQRAAPSQQGQHRALQLSWLSDTAPNWILRHLSNRVIKSRFMSDRMNKLNLLLTFQGRPSPVLSSWRRLSIVCRNPRQSEPLGMEMHLGGESVNGHSDEWMVSVHLYVTCYICWICLCEWAFVTFHYMSYMLFSLFYCSVQMTIKELSYLILWRFTLLLKVNR